MQWIYWYFIGYTGFVIFYVWFRYFNFLIYKENIYPELEAKVSVIIPCFNETPELLNRCIDSVLEAKGEKEVIIVDDGSTNKETVRALEYIKKLNKAKVIFCEVNRGKRHAQNEAMKIMTGEFMVTIDSDTIIDKNAIIELIKPFNDEKIGAVAGNVRVINRNVNWLTKTIDARYRNAFEFERQSQSTFGIVNCCSGVLSAYRSKLVKRVRLEYVNQMFLGKNCNFGDDRHLTNLILKKGFKIVFTKKSLCWTDVPKTVKDYIKQQIRWKQSFIRESLIASKFMFNKGVVFTLDTIMSMIYPLFGLVVRISVMVIPFFYPLTLIYYFVIINIMAVILNLHFLPEVKYFKFAMIYAWFHVFVVYWLYYIALYKVFVVRSRMWGTR